MTTTDEPQPETATPTHWLAVCDECRQVKQFTTERARDLWQRNHTHDGGQ